MCGFRGRSERTFNKRFAKGNASAREAGFLVGFTPAALNLYKTGVRPREEYGFFIHGASPQQKRKAKANALLSAGKAGMHPCGTTLLHQRLGPEGNPDIHIPLGQVRCWMKLWAMACGTEREMTRKSSRATFVIFEPLPQAFRWKVAHGGPLEATVIVLLDRGWKPTSPNRWLTPPDASSTRHCHGR